MRMRVNFFKFMTMVAKSSGSVEWISSVRDPLIDKDDRSIGVRMKRRVYMLQSKLLQVVWLTS